MSLSSTINVRFKLSHEVNSFTLRSLAASSDLDTMEVLCPLLSPHTRTQMSTGFVAECRAERLKARRIKASTDKKEPVAPGPKMGRGATLVAFEEAVLHAAGKRRNAHAGDHRPQCCKQCQTSMTHKSHTLKMSLSSHLDHGTARLIYEDDC